VCALALAQIEKRKLEDVSKRLGALVVKLNSREISDAVADKLYALTQGAAQRKATARKAHREGRLAVDTLCITLPRLEQAGAGRAARGQERCSSGTTASRSPARELDLT
jgi:hypothetical protein